MDDPRDTDAAPPQRRHFLRQVSAIAGETAAPSALAPPGYSCFSADAAQRAAPVVCLATLR